MDNLQRQITKIISIVVASSILLSITCFIQIPPLTTLIGLFLGWVITTKAYLIRDMKMTLLGDCMLFISIIFVVLFTTLVTSSQCLLLKNLLNCPEGLLGGCAFLVSVSLSISSFSLWLWFRINQFRYGKMV